MAVEPETGGDGHFVSGSRAVGTGGYGAFTSFRFQQGGVRGLDLHLRRLSQWAVRLFGDTPGEGALGQAIADAVSGKVEAWVRVAVSSRAISPRLPDGIVVPQITVTVSAPPPCLPDGQCLLPLAHERWLPDIKTLDTMPLVHARRQARLAGFDDAVFTDREGRLTEGTLWNLGFISDETVVWPQGRMLDGTARRLISAGLEQSGTAQEYRAVTLEDLAHFDAAFLCNSATPCAAISSIGTQGFNTGSAMMDRIRQAWLSQPLQSVFTA